LSLFVFLDLDGVLNTESSQRYWSIVDPEHSAIKLDSEAVENLNIIMKMYEPKLVISSTWRLQFKPAILKEILLANGLHIPRPEELDITPHHPPIGSEQGRGNEILAWLKNNGSPEHYLVIDDESFDIREQIPKEHTCFVTGGWHGHGFSKWHVKHAIEKLDKMGVPQCPQCPQC